MASKVWALSQIAGPGYLASSVSSLTIGTGSKTAIIQTGTAYSNGARVRFTYTGDITKYFEGKITNYISNTGSMTVLFDYVPTGASGAGPFTSWDVNLAGDKGDQGIQGIQGAGYNATAADNLAVGTGTKAFTIGTGFAYIAGDWVAAVSRADASNYMVGTVSSYTGGVLTLNVTLIGGSGSHTDWNISLTGQPGAGYTATSPTSLGINGGAQTFITQAGLAYSAGVRAIANSRANTANYMEGVVTSYSLVGGNWQLVINVDATGGSGTFADWNLNVSGHVGATGPSGGMADPGSSCVPFRTTLNTTRPALGSDLPLMVASGASHLAGAVPDPGAVAGTVKFLREDASWAVPPNPGVFGASGSGHSTGLVPDPGSTAGSSRVLYEDGSWRKPMVGMAPQLPATYSISTGTGPNGNVTTTLLNTTGDGTHVGGTLISIGIDRGASSSSPWTSLQLRVTIDGHATLYNIFASTFTFNSDWIRMSGIDGQNSAVGLLTAFNCIFTTSLLIEVVITGGTSATMSSAMNITAKYAWATS